MFKKEFSHHECCTAMDRIMVFVRLSAAANSMRSRIALLAIVFCSAFTGCDAAFERRHLPAPTRSSDQVTLDGEVGRFWGGDNFDYLNDGALHYVILRGLDAPNPGEPYYNESIDAAKSFVKGKQVRVHVVARDDMMREIADVTVGSGEVETDNSIDLGVEMIRAGWARYNGEAAERADELLTAEADAKKNKLGIWKAGK